MKQAENKNTKNEQKDFPGYPIYPAREDIYSRAKEEAELDPENPDQLKIPLEPTGKLNEKNFKEDVSGGDLDVPGSEMDDQQENIGSEDEENNLYSLGGDRED
ncbi:MAG: hypothetical protein V4635_10090 [Bacteroidota bacterium]